GGIIKYQPTIASAAAWPTVSTAIIYQTRAVNRRVGSATREYCQSSRDCAICQTRIDAEPERRECQHGCESSENVDCSASNSARGGCRRHMVLCALRTGA